MDSIAPMAIAITMLLVIGAVLRQMIVNRRMREIAKTNAELQAKLLDKVSSAGELESYLRSDAGRGFIAAATVERSNPYGRILASIQTGILMLAGGSALLFARQTLGSEARHAFEFFGILAMVVGTGFLVSSGVVYWLSKTWGLIGPRTANEDAEG